MISKKFITLYTFITLCQCIYFISHLTLFDNLHLEFIRAITYIILAISFVISGLAVAIFGSMLHKTFDFPRPSYYEDMYHEYLTLWYLLLLITPVFIFTGTSFPKTIYEPGKDIVVIMLSCWAIAANLELRFQFQEE